jgi:hypothetical protein
METNFWLFLVLCVSPCSSNVLEGLTSTWNGNPRIIMHHPLFLEEKNIRAWHIKSYTMNIIRFITQLVFCHVEFILIIVSLFKKERRRKQGVYYV